MAQVTVQELRSLFDIVADIRDERLTFVISAAARTLKSWIGAESYEDAELLEAVKFAEANLACYHLLLNTGLRVRKDGLVKQEQDAGGSVTNNVVNEYFTPDELADLRQSFYQAALDEMEPHRTASGTQKMGSLPVRPWWAEDETDV